MAQRKSGMGHLHSTDEVLGLSEMIATKIEETDRSVALSSTSRVRYSHGFTAPFQAFAGCRIEKGLYLTEGFSVSVYSASSGELVGGGASLYRTSIPGLHTLDLTSAKASTSFPTGSKLLMLVTSDIELVEESSGTCVTFNLAPSGSVSGNYDVSIELTMQRII